MKNVDIQWETRMSFGRDVVDTISKDDLAFFIVDTKESIELGRKCSKQAAEAVKMGKKLGKEADMKLIGLHELLERAQKRMAELNRK